MLRAFVNTDSRFYGFDGLTGPRFRPGYAARLLPGFDIDAVDEPGRRRLAELRDALRGLISGEPEAHGRLTRLAARVPLRLALERGDGGVRSRFVPHRDDQETVLVTEILTALQTAVLDGRLARLRICERPECGWCYYDGTKNRSGRWCSSDPCGDVMKARAFRARQASGTPGR